MKISNSIRSIYEAQYDIQMRLKKLVDEKVNSLKHDRWHYESRIKSPESFALKLETGRVDNPPGLEDYFGCMLVVENKPAAKVAESLIIANFQLKERRPREDKITHKSSESFPFDDMRLYVKWQDDPRLPPSGVNGLLFETQIKTFLQHAWSIATHDLIYKADEVSWAKERIAYQIKAMLEHAEVSILEAATLARSKELDKSNNYVNELRNIIAFIKRSWLPAVLPSDVVRLAKNVSVMLKKLEISVGELERVLKRETKRGLGTKALNLSPYGILIQSLFNQKPDKMYKFLIDARSQGFKILLPDEVEVPTGMDKGKFRNAIMC